MQHKRSSPHANSSERANSGPSSADQAGRSAALSGLLYVLASLPFLGFLVGPIFFNQVTPLVIGFPLLLAWLVLWILLTSLIMSAIYILDPENKSTSAH